MANQISTSWAESGSDTFNLLGTTPGSVAPMHIRLFAGQARTCTCEPTRAKTSLDVAFDNLIVTTEDAPVATGRMTWGRVKANR